LDDNIVGFGGTVQGIAFEVNAGFLRIIALAVSKGILSFALNSGLRRLEAHAFYEHNGYVKKQV